MYRWKPYLPVVFLVLAIAPFCWRLLASPHSSATHPTPRKVEEVQAIARQLGLYERGECPDGRGDMRLIISETPLNWERVNSLVMGRKQQSDWVGTVAVILQVREFPPLADPMIPWGNFLLYGDPALIQRLTGRNDVSEP
jgi:hypothetical protein